jgi:hypothetical protein
LVIGVTEVVGEGKQMCSDRESSEGFWQKMKTSCRLETSVEDTLLLRRYGVDADVGVGVGVGVGVAEEVSV